MSLLTFDELSELDRTDQLVDELLRVERVPGTRLVHLAVGERTGIVLTREQAAELGRELLRASGHRPARGPAAGAAVRGAPGPGAARRL